MTESASQILNNYSIEKIGRSNVHSIEVARGVNPGEVYYLCHAGSAWYIVFEADYVTDLPFIAKEASEIFGKDVRPMHWLAKKGSKTKEVKLDTNDAAARDMIILQREGDWLRYAVLAVEVSWEDAPRFNPTAYGGAS